MILFVDFETTGLVTPSSDFMAQPGIVQIGAMMDGREFSTLVNPEKTKWEENAIKTHGITPEKVAGSPTFFEIAPQFATFALGATAWAGYNTSFDRKVLWHQLMRYGFEMNFPWPLHEIDVMKLAAQKLELQGKRGNKNPKLSEAFEMICGRPMTGAHDALDDIRATAELYAEIVRS